MLKFLCVPLRRMLAWVLVVAFSVGSSYAQDDIGVGTDLFPNFSLGNFGASQDGDPATWSAKYYAGPVGRDSAGRGLVEVKVTLARSWHVYSTTQKSGGPKPTKFTITSPANISAAGDFTPDVPPAKSISSVYNGLTIEEHDGSVVWSAPIKMPADFEGSITVAVDALVCKSGDGRCMPVNEELTAEYAGIKNSVPVANALTSAIAMFESESGAEKATNTELPSLFRDGDYVVEWSASITPKQVAPGESAELTFTAKPDPTFHVYKATTDDADSSTNFVVTKKGELKIGAPQTSAVVVTKSIVPSLPPVHYYQGKVSWSLPIEVPADAVAGEQTIEGMIAYQACTDTSCHQPVALKFATKLVVADVRSSEPGTVELATTKSAIALDAAAESDWVDTISQNTDESKSTPRGEATPEAASDDKDDDDQAFVPPPSQNSKSFPVVLALAFLGGIVLNVMPCVLPVIGLKVMSFVSQAGADRGRILSLNLAYVAGIFIVFAGLATLAIVFNFGWGQQFQYFSVRLGVTVGLFAFALSYFNVWEIPVPGLAAGKTSQQLQSREGLPGAMSKGIFATLLATPCSGPMLGGVFSSTIGFAPAQIALVFMVMALGMSAPYLAIGINPSLIKWLPKPGAWMETFKQLMAFFFLAAVAYFFYQFKDENKFPVFVTLMGVWFGCWIIGLVPNWASLQKRMTAWISGITVATAIGLGAFTVLKADSELQWVNFSEAGFQQYQAEGKTVLVDFSAKWCVNCLLNLETAIDTPKTRQLVDELDVVAMYADWTDYDPEVTRKLAELQSKSIPVLAIYPADRPKDPIILRDIVTQQTVLDALRSAGPSRKPSLAAQRQRFDTTASR